MASVNTVVVRMNTPVDPETGERRRMLIETTTDYVYDEETGKTLTQIIEENKYEDASSTSSGLMTPDQVSNLSILMEDQTIISEDDPGKPCIWMKIEETT